MISSASISDRVRQAFTPTSLGIVGLTDQMLGACAGGDVVFERVGDCCVYHWTVEDDTQDGLVPIPPAAFRTILARIAVLCNERRPNSVTPYRGEGLLTVPGQPSDLLHVRFTNTPEQQQLAVKGVGRSEMSEATPQIEEPDPVPWVPESVPRS